MDFNNTINQDNNSGYVKSNTFTKKHMSMTSIAMLVVGLGFLLTGLISFGFSKLLLEWNKFDWYSSLVIGITIFCSIASIVMYIMWTFKIRKASLTFQLITITLFCISNGFSFGGIFNLLEASDIVVAFFATAAILLVTYLVSTIMSVKFAFSLMKIIGVMLMVYFIMMFSLVMMSMFNVFLPPVGQTPLLQNWTYTLIIGISGLLSILYITIELYILQKMELARDYMDNKEARNIAIYMGFSILMNLLRILYYILRIFARAKR